MDVRRREKIINEARSNFRAYLKSTDFQRFIMRLQRKPDRWNLFEWYQSRKAYRALRQIGEALTREGELLLGLVLMRNVALADKDTAAPALVLGSFDFSVAGFEGLYAIAEKIEELREHPDPTISGDIAAIFEDEEYQLFRRRKLPDCVRAPAHVMLFDEVMRGDDFFEIDIGVAVVPSPFVIMFANRSDPILASAVVPRSVAEPVLQFMVEEKARTASSLAPPPLPSSLPLPSSQPPPLSRKAAPTKGKKSVAERVVVTLSVLVAAFLVFRVAQIAFRITRHPVQREPGAEALSQASTLITGSSRGIAHGNTAEAQALAKLLSRQLKEAREATSVGGNPISADERMLTRGEFLVFCQLNPESCVFLIHVPDMRRYTDSDRDSIARLAYVTAARVLDSARKADVRRLAVATRGAILYDRVLIGDYSSESKDPLGSVTKTPDEGISAPSLNVFFEPKESPTR